MECVVNDEVAVKLAKAGYFYIHNRFTTDVLEFAKMMKGQGLPISISIGVNEEACRIIDALKANDTIPDFITIDIAHGHSEKMQWMIANLYNTYGKKSPFIIAGNVSTAEAVRDLESWGACAIKVGIGPGSACTTFNATGFGSRNIQASVIEACAAAKTRPDTMIIADGGIKDPGDIAKALVLGADVVMVGGMFSALTDSPGATVRGTDGQLYKEFWGSASVFQSGKKNRIEGTKKLLPLKTRSVLEEMDYIKECLQSAISYGGGKDLSCFKDVKYIA